MKVRSEIKTQNEQKLLRIWNGLSPPQSLALYAKVWLFATILTFKTIKNFSVKSEALRKGQPFHIWSNFWSF